MVIGNVQSFSGDFILFWGWGWGEGAMWEDLSLEKYVMGEQKFNEKGGGFSKITIKKKQWKNKHGKILSIESKEYHWNLKRTEIITHMRGSKNTLA